MKSSVISLATIDFDWGFRIKIHSNDLFEATWGFVCGLFLWFRYKFLMTDEKVLWPFFCKDQTFKSIFNVSINHQITLIFSSSTACSHQQRRLYLNYCQSSQLEQRVSANSICSCNPSSKSANCQHTSRCHSSILARRCHQLLRVEQRRSNPASASRHSGHRAVNRQFSVRRLQNQRLENSDLRHAASNWNDPLGRFGVHYRFLGYE